jgi:hypothetical protein
MGDLSLTFSEPGNVRHSPLEAFLKVEAWLIIDLAMCDAARLLWKVIVTVKQGRIAKNTLYSLVIRQKLISVRIFWRNGAHFD